MGAVVQIHERIATNGRIVVGVADMAISRDRDASIITHALGSCIGVTVFDPVAGVGGMLHFLLPAAANDEARSPEKAMMFGETGIPLLFRSCYELGARKERMIVCAAGGAEILDDDGHFKVGTRNRTLLRKIFWKNNVLLAAEDTGGQISRTLTLSLTDGTIEIRNRGNTRRLWPE